MPLTAGGSTPVKTPGISPKCLLDTVIASLQTTIPKLMGILVVVEVLVNIYSNWTP